MTEQVLDPATQKIIDDFDAHAKKRFLEMLGVTESSPLQRTREISFCLGYKAGVIDLGSALREQAINEQRDIAFDAEYERLSKTGACDNAGGMEITIEAFIRKRANDLSGAES